MGSTHVSNLHTTLLRPSLKQVPPQRKHRVSLRFCTLYFDVNNRLLMKIKERIYFGRLSIRFKCSGVRIRRVSQTHPLPLLPPPPSSSVRQSKDQSTMDEEFSESLVCHHFLLSVFSWQSREKTISSNLKVVLLKRNYFLISLHNRDLLRRPQGHQKCYPFHGRQVQRTEEEQNRKDVPILLSVSTG